MPRRDLPFMIIPSTIKQSNRTNNWPRTSPRLDCLHGTAPLNVTMATFGRDVKPVRLEYPLLAPDKRQQKESRKQPVLWFLQNGRPDQYWDVRPGMQQQPEQGPPFSWLPQHYRQQYIELRIANHLSQVATIQFYARLPQVFSNATA